MSGILAAEHVGSDCRVPANVFAVCLIRTHICRLRSARNVFCNMHACLSMDDMYELVTGGMYHMCEIVFVRNHLFFVSLCSIVDLDRKLSLRQDRDEFIKQGIIQPPVGEMLLDVCMYVCRHVHLHMYIWYTYVGTL